MDQRKNIPVASIGKQKLMRKFPQLHGSGSVQRKAAPSSVRKPPAAPPIYRPQATPKVLQRTSAIRQPSHNNSGAQASRTPTAPPAYRPQPTPKVLQKNRLCPSNPSPSAPLTELVHRLARTGLIQRRLLRSSSRSRRRSDTVLCRGPRAAPAPTSKLPRLGRTRPHALRPPWCSKRAHTHRNLDSRKDAALVWQLLRRGFN